MVAAAVLLHASAGYSLMKSILVEGLQVGCEEHDVPRLYPCTSAVEAAS